MRPIFQDKYRNVRSVVWGAAPAKIFDLSGRNSKHFKALFFTYLKLLINMFSKTYSRNMLLYLYYEMRGFMSDFQQVETPK